LQESGEIQPKAQPKQEATGVDRILAWLRKKQETNHTN